MATEHGIKGAQRMAEVAEHAMTAKIGYSPAALFRATLAAGVAEDTRDLAAAGRRPAEPGAAVRLGRPGLP